MSNEFPGDEWDQDGFESFSGFDEENDDGFEEFEAASFGDPVADEIHKDDSQKPSEPVTSPIIKSATPAADNSDSLDHDDDAAFDAGPRITRIETEEEDFVPVTYNDEDFDDIVLSPTAFRAPMASSVLTASTAKAAKGRSKGIDIAKLDEKAQRKASQPLVNEQMKQQEKSAKQQEREAKKEEKRKQLRQERIDKEQQRKKKQEERKQKQRLRKLEAQNREGANSETKPGSWRRRAVVGVAAVATAAIMVPSGMKLYSVAQGAFAQEEATVSMPSEGTESSATQSSPLTSSSTSTLAPQDSFDSYVAERCQEATSSGETTTRANGDGSTPVEAIQGFNYAYFTLRDAQAASEFLDSSMYKSVSSLQEGINHPDNGDGYCLHIQDSGSNIFKVSVIEFVKPTSEGQDPQMWKTDQTVTVKQNGNKWVISGQEITS